MTPSKEEVKARIEKDGIDYANDIEPRPGDYRDGLIRGHNDAAYSAALKNARPESALSSLREKTLEIAEQSWSACDEAFRKHMLPSDFESSDIFSDLAFNRAKERHIESIKSKL